MAERSVVVRLRAEVAGFKRAMDEAAKATDKVKDSGAQADTTLGRMVQSAEKNRQAWDTAGAALAGFGTLTLAGLGMATRAAVQWESAWTGVLKTVDGSDAEIAALEGDLRELARTLPATHQEIAAVAEAAGQLGVATPHVAAFTRTMIDLGETTNLTADEAATAIAQMMNVMRTAPDEVDNLGAALVQLGNNGASTERDIIYMAQRIAGAGKIIGLTEGEVLGLANALASVGIEVEAGGSAISRIMTDIHKSVSQGSDELELWAHVAGVSAQDFAAAWRRDPADALAMFIEGLGRMQAAGEDVFTVLDDLGQSDVRVSRALLTMATSGDLLRESLQMGNEAWAENTALVEEAAKRYDTTEAKLQVAKNAINDAAITVGETFTPILADAAEGVASFAEWIGSLPTPLVQAASGLAGVAGAASLAAGAFLLTFPRVMDTVTAFKTLQRTSPATAAAIGKVGKALGVLAFAAVAVEVGEYIGAAQVATVETDKLATELLSLADGAKEVGPALGELFAKGQGPFRREMESTEDVIRSFANTAREALSDNFWERLDRNLDIGGSEMAKFRAQTEQLDKALTAMVEGGQADAAAEVMQKLTDAAVAQGVPVEKLNELFPQYQAVTEEAAAAADAATGSAQGLAGGLAEVSPVLQENTDAMNEWREGVYESMGSFVDLMGAYQGVVDKNRELAESTAAATKSSKDSWEDYYDGVSVTTADLITQMQAQVTAQEKWAENMTVLSERVNTTMAGGMRDTANRMIDELLELGPEGAAAVEALRNASDEELALMVELYGRKGAAAAGELVAEVESHRPPMMTVQVDTSQAMARLSALNSTLNSIDGRTVRAAVAIRQYGQAAVASGGYMGDFAAIGLADGGPARRFPYGGQVLGPGTATSDSIPAWLSTTEFVQRGAAVDKYGLRFMHDVNNLRFPVELARGYRDGGSVSAPQPVGWGVPMGGDPTPAAAPVEIVGQKNFGPVYMRDEDAPRRGAQYINDALAKRGVPTRGGL